MAHPAQQGAARGVRGAGPGQRGAVGQGHCDPCSGHCGLMFLLAQLKNSREVFNCCICVVVDRRPSYKLPAAGRWELAPTQTWREDVTSGGCSRALLLTLFFQAQLCRYRRSTCSFPAACCRGKLLNSVPPEPLWTPWLVLPQHCPLPSLAVICLCVLFFYC